MKFGIVILHERKRIRLTIEKVESTPAMEKFTVTARNTSYTIQTNRPLLRNKGLKHKRAIWKEVSGGIHNRSVMESIIKAIEARLDEFEML